MDRRSILFQTTAAIIALACGVLVYLIDRQPASVYFIPDWINLSKYFNPIFNEIGNYLPTFIHVFVFILLTTIVVAPSPTQVILICASWFTADSLFEIAQFAPIAKWIVGNVPDWFTGIPFLENTSAYFMNGNFDVIDLVSIAAGTITAYLVIHISHHGRKQHVPDA